MARAAVKAKQQARGKAAQPGKARPRGRRKGSGGGNPNQQLFFERMRRHAKWAYVLLALLFAITFAALGVGSGQSSGLDQIFSGLFGGGGGSSIAQAQKEVAKNPKSAKGYRDLATAYEAHSQTASAISALQSYLAIKKKDANAWAELGGLQTQQSQQYGSAYQAAAQQQQLAAPSQAFLPTGTLGTAIGTNQVESAASQQASQGTSLLYEQAISAAQAALTSFQQVAKLRPNDPNAQYGVANAAQAAGNNTVAVAALQRYLKLDPQTPQRSQIEALIKQLSPQPSTPAKKAKKSSKTGK